jgi:hypothetical protein
MRRKEKMKCPQLMERELIGSRQQERQSFQKVKASEFGTNFTRYIHLHVDPSYIRLSILRTFLSMYLTLEIPWAQGVGLSNSISRKRHHTSI